MAAAKLVVASLLVTALWASCALLPAAMAADHTSAATAATSALPTAAATGVPPLADSSTAGAIPATTTGTTLPAAAGTTTAAAAEALQSSSPPATPSAAESTSSSTAPKKFPLPNPGVEPQPVVEPHPGVEPHIGGGGEPYNPAAEVASALPVPTPDELPSGASLGFGDHGEGVLGYGGPGDACCGGPGGYGWFGGPGGFGPGTYGYNGPLYWGAAPVTAANVVVPLLLACVAVAVLA